MFLNSTTEMGTVFTVDEAQPYTYKRKLKQSGIVKKEYTPTDKRGGI